MDINIIKKPISFQQLKKIAEDNHGNMVKGVVDIGLGIIALGGELHADAEALLLQNGSEQENLWGFNIYTNKPDDQRIEYHSFINIRPNQDNRSLEIQSQELKRKIKRIIDYLVEGKNG
jgi:hypothetical protein